MASSYNPKIVTDGLVLCLDAANPKSFKSDKSIIKTFSWKAGSGSVTGYSQYGSSTENVRKVDTDPWGNQSIVWESVNADDAAQFTDGGWVTSTFVPDITKLYRYSVWVKRKVLGNGSFNFGAGMQSGSPDINSLLNRVTGGVNNNPYFYGSSWQLNQNQWYLVVGHVWPVNSGTGSIHVNSGFYDTSGNKVLSLQQEFVWQSTNTLNVHRVFLVGSSILTTNQQLAAPRVDICDGTEPTLTELLSNDINKFKDLAGSSTKGTLINSPIYDTNNKGIVTFDGINDRIDCGTYFPNIIDGTNNFSIECCVYPKSPQATYADIWGNHTEPFSGIVLQQSGSEQNYYTWGFGCGTFWGTTSGKFYLSENKWNHLVAVRSGSTLAVYINGIFIISGTEPAALVPNSTFNFQIGTGYNLNSSRYWNGSVSNFKVYNRALSATEINQNFQALRDRYGI